MDTPINKLDVKVMVVKTRILFPKGISEGFIADDAGLFLKLIRKNVEFKRRGDVEEDEIYQQIVAQIILTVEKKVLIHRIPITGNEGRLHDMWPIFIGGHIDSTDKKIEKGLEREFEEELNYQGKITEKKYLGLIKKHDNPVNKVHIGLVWLYKGDSLNFADNNDRGLADARFFTAKELKKYENKLTYWSEIFLPYLKNYI